MKATEALRMMVKSADKTALQISTEIGRKPNYVASLINRGSVPSVETFASIAEACGARLLLELPEKTIQLDGWEVASTRVIPIEDGSDAAEAQRIRMVMEEAR